MLRTKEGLRFGDRLAVSGQRFVKRLDAEPGVHGVRQPPRKDMARRPVHDRDQVQEVALDRDVGDVGAPDLIGTIHAVIALVMVLTN